VAETTARLALPLLVAGQGQKDITHNEALMGLDALLHPVVESLAAAVPPSSPLAGSCWVVASGATGAWQGEDGKLAVWTDGGWRHHVPVEGLMVRLRSSGQLYRFWGGVFAAELPLAAGAAVIPPPSGGGVVDSEAREAISAILERLFALGLVSGS
jgi:hypothetical protein